MNTALIDTAVETAAALDLRRVPEPVVVHAGHVVADTIAVARGGARQPEIARLVELGVEEGVVATEEGGAPSTVLTSPVRRCSAAYAAFLNGTAGTFLELDEGMRPTGHPAMHVLPAALAVAERCHASGADLLRAVLAGYETTSRLFRAFRLRYPVHPHGHFGAVGAAVAAALLDGTDVVAAARIAGTTPLLPVWDACFEGATARNTYTGLAAQSGVRACTLARAGFTGSERALEVTYGEIAGELVDPDALTHPLDYDDLGITRNYFKVHSACALSHAAIDAVTTMDVPAATDIRRVRVETVRNNMKLDRQPRHNDLSGRFSLPYAVATAILLRRTDPEAFRFRPEVAELARKVEISVAADLEAQWPDASPARVVVESVNGTEIGTVGNPRGHHLAPITEGELRDKFFRLVDDGEAERWWSRLCGLRDVADCATLLSGCG